MSSNYQGDLYLASLAAGAGIDPDEPTNDPRMQRSRNELIKLREKLYSGLNTELARYERQQLATEAKLYENVNTTRAKVFESIQQNKRVSAKNATEIKTTLAEIQSDLRQKIGGSSPAFSPIQQAYNSAKGGQAGLQAAARELIAWKDSFGRPLDINNAEIGGIMNRVATMAVPGSQDISRVTRDQFLSALGNVDQGTLDQVGRLFDAGQQRYNEISGALATLSDAEGTVDGIARSLQGTVASSDPSLLAQLNKVANDIGPALGRGLGRSAADIAAAQEQYIEQNKEMLRLQDDIERIDRRAPSDQDRMGRIVANPTFRAWAEGNGFRIGSATVSPEGKVTYAPMVDDAKALALFNYQAKTGKQGPLFASTSTGKNVRVTYEDPESREKALATYGKNGQFYMNADNELVTPTEAARAMNPGNTIQVGAKDGAPVFKLPDGRTVNASGATVSAEGVQFVPGTIDTATGTRYLVPSDLEGLDLDKLGVANTNDLAQAASKGSAELAKITVTDEAGARQAWTGVVVGKLDRPNARRVIEEGAGYISLDGGKVSIPATAKATIELMPTGTEAEPLTKTQRLAEADKAAAETAAPAAGAARETAPMVEVPTVGPAGVPKTLTVSPTSTAAATAAAEGRDIKVAGAAAPAAAAPAAAPAAATATGKAYYKDNEGSLFEVGDDGITLVNYKGEKPPAGMKTEFKNDDPALPLVAGNLSAKGQRVEAPEPVAPAKPEVATGKPAAERLAEGRAPSMREPEPEPTIGRRSKAAVVVYPEAEGEKKPGILEKVRSLFPGRKKAGEEGEEMPETKAGAPEVPGTAPAAEAGAKSPVAKVDEQKRRAALADLVAGAAEGVPERAPNAAVPPTFEERARVAPAQFQMAQSAAGTRGEGPSTLTVNVSRRGEDIEPVTGTTYGARSADKKVEAGRLDLTAQRAKERAAALDFAQEADIAQRVAERRRQVASGRPGLSTFNRARGEDTEPTKGTAYGAGPAAKPATEQKEPTNMPSTVPMGRDEGFMLEGAPRQNLFRVDQPTNGKPKLSRFDKFRQAAFPPAAQE